MDNVRQKHVATDMSTTDFLVVTKRKLANLTDLVKIQSDQTQTKWKRLHWLRGYLWSENDVSKMPSTTATETADPMPKVQISELHAPNTNKTISKNHQLFKIVTPMLTDLNTFCLVIQTAFQCPRDFIKVSGHMPT